MLFDGGLEKHIHIYIDFDSIKQQQGEFFISIIELRKAKKEQELINIIQYVKQKSVM